MGNIPVPNICPLVVSLDNQPDAVRKRVGVSVVKDKARGDYIVKLAESASREGRFPHTVGGSFMDPFATKRLTGEPQSKDAKPVTSPFEIGGEEFSYEMPPIHLR